MQFRLWKNLLHLFKKNKAKSKSIISFLMSSGITINDEDKKREKLLWTIRKRGIPIPNLGIYLGRFLQILKSFQIAWKCKFVDGSSFPFRRPSNIQQRREGKGERENKGKILRDNTMQNRSTNIKKTLYTAYI